MLKSVSKIATKKIVFLFITVFLIAPLLLFFIINLVSAVGDITTGYKLNNYSGVQFSAHGRNINITNSLLPKDIFIPTKTQAELDSFCNSSKINGACSSGSLRISPPDCGSVEYGGKTYATVRIADQCWFAENLDIGTQILVSGTGAAAQTDNGVIEKYCLNNNASSCETNGGYYMWNEAMAYSSSEEAQGICPSGWHIPSDADFLLLEQAVLAIINSPNAQTSCDLNSLTYARCCDSNGINTGEYGVSKALKMIGFGTTTVLGIGQDLVGFNARPNAAVVGPPFNVSSINTGHGQIWTSTIDVASARPIIRGFLDGYPGPQRKTYPDYYGFGIRCLKD